MMAMCAMYVGRGVHIHDRLGNVVQDINIPEKSQMVVVGIHLIIGST